MIPISIKTEYDTNIRKALGWEDEDIKNLKSVFGIIKKQKKSPVVLQRNIRKELEIRVKKLK